MNVRHISCVLLLSTLLIPLGAFTQMDSATALRICNRDYLAFDLLETLAENAIVTTNGIGLNSSGIGVSSDNEPISTLNVDSLAGQDTVFFARIYKEDSQNLSLLKRHKIKAVIDCYNCEMLYEAGFLNDLKFSDNCKFKGKDIALDKLETVVHHFAGTKQMPHYIRNSKNITFLGIDFFGRKKRFYEFLPPKLKYLRLGTDANKNGKIYAPNTLFAPLNLKIVTIISYPRSNDLVFEQKDFVTPCSVEALETFNLDISNPINQKKLLSFKNLKYLAAKISKPIDLESIVEKYQLTSLYIYVVDKKLAYDYFLRYKDNARIKIYSDSNPPVGRDFFCGGGQYFNKPF